MVVSRRLLQFSVSLESVSSLRLSFSPSVRLFSHTASPGGKTGSNQLVKFGQSSHCCLSNQSQVLNSHVTRYYSTRRKQHDHGKKHKDLYAIMGVSPHATQVQIKEAYYRLSMKYHPDRNKGAEDAHTKFTELTEAYSILGQYDLRRKYDKGMLHQYPRQPSHTHSDHSHHHSTARDSGSTVHGKRSKFDFDEFYRAHYGEALRREQEARRSRAAAREKAKLYSISNSWQQVLIIGVCLSVLLVGMYGYHWLEKRTSVFSHDES